MNFHFFKEGEGKELFNDIDFLLKFWKKIIIIMFQQ